MTRRRRWLWMLLAAVVVVMLGWSQREWIVARLYLWTLESSPRVAELQVERVVAALRIQPGQSVADLGAGTGLFARAFSSEVGASGTVYAVDVNEKLLAHIEHDAERRDLDNIRVVHATADDARIPQLVDLVFVCDTLHHIENRGPYLRGLRRYLKPGGRLAIIDPAENAPHIDAVVVPSMRYTMSELDAWMRDADFELAETYDFPEDYFFMIFTCRSCPAP